MGRSWRSKALALAASVTLVLAAVFGPALGALAATQSVTQTTGVNVACTVGLSLGNAALAFGTVAPGQTSNAIPDYVYWTDSCGTTFSGTGAVTDLVDYAVSGSPGTSSSGTFSSCGGSIGCIPAYNADIQISLGTPTCVSAASGSCSGATAPTKSGSTVFGFVAGTCIDTQNGLSLTCPTTMITGTSGSYTPGEWSQDETFTLHVPSNAQQGTYAGYAQYTITG